MFGMVRGRPYKRFQKIFHIPVSITCYYIFRKWSSMFATSLMKIYLFKKMDFNSFKLNPMIFNSWKINMQNMWFVSICNNNPMGFNFQQISIKISLFLLLDLLRIILWWTSIVAMVYKFFTFLVKFFW
jgi:hypothetical protein